MNAANMATLQIASKANQAATLPALLVASYAKESDPNASLNVNFEEVDILKSSSKAAIELVVGNRPSCIGLEKVISELCELYPLIQGKNEQDVCCCTSVFKRYLSVTFPRSTNG